MTVITITTDFGTADGYVAAMKGVMLGIAPELNIVDITHEIRLQKVDEASFVLATIVKFFPPGTIHLAVIDPGVGTARRALAIGTPECCFVGPDNGLFTFPLLEYCRDFIDIDNGRINLRYPVTAVSLDRPEFWLKEVSNTFHGRDIFAPVAAHLSEGIPLLSLGTPVDAILSLPGYVPPQTDNLGIRGHVIHIDRFGNIITDIRRSDIPRTATILTVEIKGKVISNIVKTYAEANGLAGLFGGSGYLEIAVPNGRAADLLRVSVGDQVRVTLR